MKYLLIFIFLAGMLFYIKPGIEGFEGKKEAVKQTQVETFDTDTIEINQGTCPNILLEKDSKYHLFNKNKPYKEGENPITFDSLEDYSSFVKRENTRGNKCPILFLQQSYNVQGNREYKIRPSPTDLQGGAPPIKVTKQTYLDMFKGTELLVDANESDKPYNENSYPGFDPMDQQIGTKTPLDLMNLIQETKDLSPNPEDPNWGGNVYTQSLVDSGYYAANEVLRYQK